MADVLDPAVATIVREHARLEVALFSFPKADHRFRLVVADGSGPEVFAFRIRIPGAVRRMLELPAVREIFGPIARRTCKDWIPFQGGGAHRVPFPVVGRKEPLFEVLPRPDSGNKCRRDQKNGKCRRDPARTRHGAPLRLSSGLFAERKSPNS